MLSHIRFSALIVLSLCAQAAAASDLKDCRQKIYEMYRPLASTEAKELTQGVDPASARSDSYHMRADNTCGVEVLEDKGILRVVRFEKANPSKIRQLKFQVLYPQLTQILGIKKFETIKLDENDPTYADGRIKAKVSCKIDGETVIYTTQTPVYADGVSSPFGVTELELNRDGDLLSISLTAGVSGAAWPFKSVTACNLRK